MKPIEQFQRLWAKLRMLIKVLSKFENVKAKLKISSKVANNRKIGSSV